MEAANSYKTRIVKRNIYIYIYMNKNATKIKERFVSHLKHDIFPLYKSLV